MGGIYWLASYPKSGNTWFRTFLANLTSGSDTPVDINELQNTIASSRGWLDEVLGFDTADLLPHEVDVLRPHVYRWTLNAVGPSYHKIHDAYHAVGVDAGGEAVPSGQAGAGAADGVGGVAGAGAGTGGEAGLVAGAGAGAGAVEPLTSREATLGALYIIRNPLDVAPSYANHRGSSIDSAIDAMCDPNHALSRSSRGLAQQVRQRLGTWSQHVTSWVDAPDLRCMVIRYEDMLGDLVPTFTRAAEFLRVPHDVALIARALDFSSFDRLVEMERVHGFREKSPTRGPFFRLGFQESWKFVLNPAQVRRIIDAHGPIMRRFGYLDERGEPIDQGAGGAAAGDRGAAAGGGGAEPNP